MGLLNRLRPYFPWSVESGVRSTLLILACAVGLIISWAGAHSRHVFQNQISWLIAGIVVLMVSCYAHASHFIRARRAIGIRRARLLSNALVRIEPGSGLSLLDGWPTAELEISRIDRVLVAEGLSMYHRTGCPMASGRSSSLVTRQAAQLRSLEPCGICFSDGTANRSRRGANA